MVVALRPSFSFLFSFFPFPPTPFPWDAMPGRQAGAAAAAGEGTYFYHCAPLVPYLLVLCSFFVVVLGKFFPRI